jgi:predicted O-methyltransferase YrrM
VVSYLSCFVRMQIHKGECADIIGDLMEQKYRMVHIDVDLFQPTLTCLEYFGPRLVHGGIIVLDDYGSPKCPGVKKALKLFLKKSTRYSQWLIQTEQAVLVRI